MISFGSGEIVGPMVRGLLAAVAFMAAISPDPGAGSVF
jgi:hypothetical protein